jgi:hypothetical protein
VAVEAQRAEADASLSAMTFACELEAMAAGAARTRLFDLAGRIGLSADATGMVLDQYERRAKLVHQVFTQSHRSDGGGRGATGLSPPRVMTRALLAGLMDHARMPTLANDTRRSRRPISPIRRRSAGTPTARSIRTHRTGQRSRDLPGCSQMLTFLRASSSCSLQTTMPDAAATANSIRWF